MGLPYAENSGRNKGVLFSALRDGGCRRNAGLAEGLAACLSAERGLSCGGGFTVFQGKPWYARPG